MRALCGWRFCGLMLLVATAGCNTLAMPRLFHPGPIRDQQYAAEKSNDLPDDSGQPMQNGNGIMPPGYIPRAEAQQSRNFIPNPWFQPNQSYYRANTTSPSNVYRPGLFPSQDAMGGTGGGTGGGASSNFY